MERYTYYIGGKRLLLHESQGKDGRVSTLDLSLIAICLSPCRFPDRSTFERYCEETDTWETLGELPPKRGPYVSLRLNKDATTANETSTADALAVN